MFNRTFMGGEGGVGGGYVPSAPLPILLPDGNGSPTLTETDSLLPVYQTANTSPTSLLALAGAVAGNACKLTIGDDLTIIDLGGLIYYPRTGDWLDLFYDGTSWSVVLYDSHNPNCETLPGQAGENLAAYDLCYLKSDGKYWKTDSDTAAKMPGSVIAARSMSADGYGTFLLKGIITNNAWSWATKGALLYAQGDTIGTPGLMTLTAPSGSGYQVTPVGMVLATTSIYFNPDYILMEVA